MPIQFTCSGCNNRLNVPDEHAGKQAKCPSCQAINSIPEATQTDVNPFADPLPEPKPAFGQEVGAVAGGYAGQPYGAPMHGQGHYTPHRGNMILIFGILAIVCNMMLVPGILAWIMGKSDLKEMDAGIMDPEGRSMTSAGMIMGMVMTLLAAAVFLFYVLFFVFILVVGAAGIAAG